MERECARYGLDPERTAAVLRGDDPLSTAPHARRWWEAIVVAAAVGVFVWLASIAARQPIAVNPNWAILLAAATLVFLAVGATWLWRRTRFS